MVDKRQGVPLTGGQEPDISGTPPSRRQPADLRRARQGRNLALLLSLLGLAVLFYVVTLVRLGD